MEKIEITRILPPDLTRRRRVEYRYTDLSRNEVYTGLYRIPLDEKELEESKMKRDLEVEILNISSNGKLREHLKTEQEIEAHLNQLWRAGVFNDLNLDQFLDQLLA